MQNETQKFTNENAVTAKSLLEEIQIILKDYFKGEIAACNNGIQYRLPNGQKFILSAKEEA